MELDQVLLHSPPIAGGWNLLFGSIRRQTSLSADIREIAICRVALLNNTQYEWSYHTPPGREAGVNEYRLMEEGEYLTQRQLAVLRYTDAMTKNVAISDDVSRFEATFHR